MPKTPRYSTRSVRRRSESPIKPSAVSEFIDDEAHESDLEGEGDPDGTPPPAEQSSITAPVKDMAVLASDDSMFRKPVGVKATALPPALVTRSKRTSTDSPLAAVDIPAKKARRARPVSPSVIAKSSTGRVAPPTQMAFDPDAMAEFMSGWMDEFMAKQAAKSVTATPTKSERIDFDQLELARGLAVSGAHKLASKTAGSAKAKVAAGTVARVSPAWDIEDDEPELNISRANKGKGKPIASSSRSQQAKCVVALVVFYFGLRGMDRDVEDIFDASLEDKSLTDVVDKARAASRSQLASFVVKTRKGATRAAVNSALDNEKMTMAKFFKDHASVLVDAEVESRASSVSEAGDPPSIAFLEDLETYKSFYDPDAQCGVYDVDIQDPALSSTYRNLPPLPGGRQVLPAYDPSRLSGGSYEEDTKGGRAKFGSWKSHIKNMLARNCIGAMLFVESKPNFINPSRASPLVLSRQLAAGASGTQRLMYDNKIAVCVSAVFCTESVVVTAAKIGGKSERLRKWVSGIFHNQDWERFEALMCLVFGQDILYAQINNKKAISFQSMISPENSSGSKDPDTRFDKNAPVDMFSPIVAKKGTPSRPKPRPIGTPSKTLLAFDEHLPVYDARKTAFDFEFDLPRISAVLPSFTGEIPFSSFVVVGYTASTYNGSLGGTTERVTHLGCNVVWVIVCGTPTLRR
ncbi:hypothetical protein B0H16DRAFT_1482942 [Mycena metata]|uniref:Uncharacterized protein n=1 Tax=Mycena metata TaxID=1033252 RepID=A0AAD7DZJ6_9AGAR|nr:hypothetical protein B0H16DRAFT_1482942 [Mycena metata]